MRKLTFARSRAIFTFSRAAMMIWCALLAFNVQSWSQCTPESNTISGTVFEDSFNDGEFRSSEKGLGNVLVTVYDASGSSVGSAITDTDGNYAISNLNDTDSYRLEFQSSNGYYSSFQGEDNRSSVQFVDAPACEVNYGLTREISSCSSNPDLVLTCFVQGEIDENPNFETIISTEHDFGVDSDVSVLARANETGSVWGITQDVINQNIYTSAFVKQYAGLKYGPYAILQTQLEGSKATSLFADISAIIPQSLSGLTVTDVHNCTYGNQVGRVGLGNLIISPDSRTLYTTVLDEGLVVSIELDDPTANGAKVFEMPRPIDIDDDEEYRIFALEWHDDLIYVGGTVTASVSQNKNKSQGVVMTLDPTTGDIQEVFRTDFLKGFWQDDKPDALAVNHWFTDIDFTSGGEMLISFSDRVGHRYCKNSTNRLDQQFPDLLIVAYNPITEEWELENNGSIAGRPGSGVGNGDGPGGGEFFGFENWPTNPTYHNETALGSVYVLPGSDEVIVSVYDPLINSYSGGLHRYSTLDGSKTGAIELYSHTIFPTFGKATGFGDIIARCEVQTIEIGNYVWNDTNGNGLQDANEDGIGGIRLNLYDDECNLIGTTVTDAEGVYVFNNTNVDNDGNGSFDGVYPNTTYYVELDNTLYNTETGLYTFDNNEFTICTANAGGSEDDMIDCDAEYNDAVCLSSSFIEVNTDETNHSFDIALGTPSGFDLALRKEIVGNKFAKVGEELIFMITIFNQGGVSASSVTITDYMPDGYEFVEEVNQGWSLEDGVLTTTINQRIIPGTNVSRTLRLLVSSAQATDYTNVAEISKALNLSGTEGDDEDSTPDDIMSNDTGGEPFTSTDDQINGVGVIDEDDHDPAVPEIFDLAVNIKLNDDKYYYGGDLVKFDIKLFNQGNVDAERVKLANYFPAELIFNEEFSTGWSLENGYAVLTETDIIVAGQTRDYCIYFNVDAANTSPEILNNIEIMQSIPVGSTSSFDFDSEPDNIPDNDIGGQIYTATDNEINDHGVTDEDDHDPVIIKTQFVDFALMKTTEKTRFKAGELVAFDIEILNQGSVAASEVVIADYIPSGMTLEDDNWSMPTPGTATRTVVFDTPLTTGNKEKTTILLRINDNQEPGALVNYAEIVNAADEDNEMVGDRDIDSSPDAFNDNDNGGVPGTNTDNEVNLSRDIDEDDHDPARIIVISSSITGSECLSNATNTVNGQFQDDFKITGPSGDTWFVADQNNYFSIESPEPGDGVPTPQPIGESVTLTEMPITPDNGMSMYTISVLREDGDAGFIVFRSDDDEIESFNVPAQMYTDIFINGNLALCDGETEEYCITNPVPNVVYNWTTDAGTSAVTITPQNANATCVVVDWGGATPDTDYLLSVTPDDGCIAPGAFTVSIGSQSGSMSCLGNINLSLNSDCEIVVNPELILTTPVVQGQAYNVMLTTQSGEVIPNATITADHIGTTVTAKIIDACNGNSCWSSIFVEDKLIPTIDCQDVTIACNKIDEYPGPFAEDNCGTIAAVTLLKDSLQTLECDDFAAIIHREYQATDAQGNKSEICTMQMFVEHVDLDDIVFPDPLLMMNNTALNCDSYDLDNDGVADLDVTGFPTYNNEIVYPNFGQLCNTAITFEDDERIINGVRKITRTWTAWKWVCGDSETREVDQLIEVRDTEAPTLVCPTDITVSAQTSNCSGTVNLPIPQIDDSCTPDGLTYTIKPPFGALIKEGDSRVVTFPYSPTPYDVVYTAIDGAGLSTSCTVQVFVSDDIAPVAICEQNTVIGLNSNGIGYAYALNIDDGSYDACGVASIEIRRMDLGGDFSDRVEFSCADLTAPVVVELKVTDDSGLMNTCMANVFVQDKHAPQVFGPADMEIECGTDFLPLSQFGEFSFTDACNVDTVTTSSININSCGIGTITRTFTATDSSGTVSVSQTINIVNNNPFDFGTVVFPRDTMLTIGTCDIDGLTDPDNLPDGYNYPEFNTVAQCQMVSASPHDEIYSLFNDDESVCFKIVRTWTVIDWCQLDENGNPLEATDIQTISVTSTKAPDDISVTGLDDPIVATTCDSAMVTFTASSSDCNPGNLQSQIQVDIDNDGDFDISIGGAGASTTFSQMLPMGSHTVLVTFVNPCGLMKSTSFPINITNNIPPNIACKNVAIGLEPWDTDGIDGPDTEAACIQVDTLALASGTFHQCMVDFELSFSATEIVKELCFDCNDLGLNNIEIFAIDANGNISSCISEVDVQDNNDTDICMDVKDCTTFVTDVLVSTNLECEFQVTDNTLNVTQVLPDCGTLTITHDYNNPVGGNTTLFGATFPVGTTIVNWTVTNGLMVEVCQLTVVVEDNENPTIDCADDVTINTSTFTGCIFTQVGTSLDPDVDDNCMTTSIEHDYDDAPSNTTLDGATFPIGTTVVEFTVVDGNGNEATCTTTITVEDNEGPTLACANDQTFGDTADGDSGCDHTVTGAGLDPATPTDECGTIESLVHNYNSAPSNTTLDGATFPLGTTTVTFTATDNNGNTSTCQVTVTVTDDINPSITCAPSTTVDAGSNSDCEFIQVGEGLDPIATSENCDQLGVTITHNYDATNSVNNTTLAGATFPLGIHTITWTIEDAAGNTATCQVVVTVVDDTAPDCVDQGGPIDITIGGDQTITLTSADLNTQYTDNCSAVTVTFDPPTLDCDPVGLVNVTATVTDASNNSVDCPLQFNVVADENVSCELNIDTIYLDANGQVTINAEDVVNIVGGGCGIDYTPSIDFTSFSCSDIADNPITITISANGDVCGTDELVVLDTLAPVITCVGNQTFDDSDDGVNDCQHTVSGTVLDPEVSDPCVPTTMINDYNNLGSLDGAIFPVGGPYTINWTVTDANGNSSTCTYTVTVEDDVAPTCVDQGIIDITLNPGDIITIVEDSLTTPFTDNCGVVSVTFVPTTITCEDSGILDVTATVTDAAGNESECPVQFNVIVNENVMCAFNIDTVYLNEDGEFTIDPELIVDVTGGVCGNEPVITVDQGFASCNDVMLNPFNVTIFADGMVCGMDSLTVLDTLPPSLNCDEITISCAEFEANFNSVAEFLSSNEPTADDVSDNCNSLIIITTAEDTTALNECSQGTIIRTIIAEDPLSGKMDTCMQNIIIEGAADPLTQADVDGIIPSMITTTGCTGMGAPDVVEITIDSLTPLVDCGMFTVDFEDVSIAAGCPDTINRTYTIEAICQDGEMFTFLQQIIINDIEDPSIASIADTTVIANPATCEASINLSGYINAMDNCTADENVSVTYAFEMGNDVGLDETFDLGTGEYTVTVTAVDECQNMAIDSFDLMVSDTSEIFVVCQKLVRELDPVTATVDVSSFEGFTVSGNCDGETLIIGTWNPDDFNDTIVTLDCATANTFKTELLYLFEVVENDMGGFDTIPFDLSPNVEGDNNECKVEIEVQDPSNACNMIIFNIQGDVTTVDGVGIPNYRMTLHGSTADAVMSEEDGFYSFPQMPEGGDYTIGTFKNDDVLNGVSTLDLIMIQRHILGLAEFDSPYKYIAADITNDEKVSSPDLIALRKVILGINIEFPNNLSWRTIDAEHNFSDPTDPWVTPIPESYDIQNLSNSMYVDFVGVKIGDINGNASVNAQGTSTSIRSNKSTTLSSIAENGTIAVSATEEMNIAGLQMTINTNGQTIANIKSDVFNEDGIGYYETETGLYNISIADHKLLNVQTDDVLFELEFDCIDCDLTAIQLSDKGISSEIYANETFEVVSFNIERRDASNNILAFSVSQNNPNPWSAFTQINVTLQDASDITLNVFDLTGRLVYTKVDRLQAGTSTIELDQNTIQGEGVYYYEISTATQRAQYKMIKLK